MIAKNTLDFELTGTDIEQKRYYALAVSSYKRAIEIEPKYSKAISALSVLYLFELDKPQEAIPLLESVVEREQKPLQHLFLLARAYYMIGENEKAVSAYEKIISLTGSAEQKKEAENNIKLIREK